MSLVRASNGLFQSAEPWKLKKEGQIEKWNASLAVAMETARVVGILLQPIIPSFSDRLLSKLRYIQPLLIYTFKITAPNISGKLGVDLKERSWKYGTARWTDQDQPLGSQETVLFPKIKAVE